MISFDTIYMTRFKRVSEDFLILMNRKYRQAAKKNRYAASEVATMESFYKGIEGLLSNLENEEIHLKVQIKYWQTMCDVLKQELEKAERNNLLVSKRPTKKKLQQIKERFCQGKVTIATIFDHFYLTDDEVKVLIDAEKSMVEQAQTS